MHTANGEMWYVEHGAKFTKEKTERNDKIHIDRHIHSDRIRQREIIKFI